MPMFGEPTDSLIRTALSRQHVGVKLTGEDKVLLTLRFGKWVGTQDMVQDCGHRFGSAVNTLRAKGVNIDTQADPHAPKGERWYRYCILATDEGRRLF